MYLHHRQHRHVLMLTAKQCKRKIMPLLKYKIILFIKDGKYRFGYESLRTHNSAVVSGKMEISVFKVGAAPLC